MRRSVAVVIEASHDLDDGAGGEIAGDNGDANPILIGASRGCGRGGGGTGFMSGTPDASFAAKGHR
jgi:hypothetical protein